MAELSLPCKHLQYASDVARALEGRDLAALRSVVLSSNELDQDPFSALPNVEEMRGVTKLLLGFNKLRVFPHSVLALERLAVLHLNNNLLMGLPPELCSLRNLETLVLSDNLLVELPKELGQLKQLVHLDVSKNRLLRLPPSICWLSSLKRLSLTDNALRVLPYDMDRLTALEQLRLAGNNMGRMLGAENRSGKELVQQQLALIVAPWTCQRALYCLLAIHRFRGDECPELARIPRDVLRFVVAPLVARVWPALPKNYSFSIFKK